MPTDEKVIQTIRLTKVFRDFWHRPKVRAVDELDLEVHRGEVFGLLGPNGSGKSTTMKLLLGLLFPTSGTVRVLGRPPRDIQVKRRLGFLPEETYLYPYLNAFETLDFFGRLAGLSRRERRKRAEALIEMVGLKRARNRPLREYSKGMARRIGLAQALVADPELLLLDEPTTGLDPIGAREVKDLVLHLKERGKTILLCSHLLAHVEDVCDRVGILYGGRLLRCGRVEDLLAQRKAVQVIIPEVAPEQVESIKSVLQGFAGAEVRVSHPMERLEEFFLRVIAEAREQRLETAGVGAGRFEPGLFRKVERRPEPEAVIERLTAVPTEPQAEEEAPKPEPREQQAEPAVVERLTARPEPQEQPPAEPPQPSPEEKEAASVIERLVQNPPPPREDQNPEEERP